MHSYHQIFIRDEEDNENKYPVSKHPSSFIDKSRRKHLVDAVTAAVAARKKDEKEEAKSKSKGKLKQIKKYSLMMNLHFYLYLIYGKKFTILNYIFRIRCAKNF